MSFQLLINREIVLPLESYRLILLYILWVIKLL